MSIGRGEQVTVVVPYERVLAIAAGEIPGSVSEVDAVGEVAGQFQPLWSSMDKQRQNPGIYGRYIDGVAQPEVISPLEYQQLAARGSRDYWRQDEPLQVALREIAIGGVPQGYETLFAKAAHDPAVQEVIRQDAFSLLVLSQEIAEVERAERAEATIREREEWRAMRLPSMTTTVFEQETVTLPIVKRQRSPEVTTHRAKPKSRFFIAIGSVANKVSAFFEPVFV